MVRRAHRAFDRALQARLAPHGITTGYWYYLRVLWHDDGLSQRELSRRVNVAENTTTAMIAAMARDGLVVRKRDPRDRRRSIVSLTARGDALKATLLPFVGEVNALAAEGIDDGELAGFLKTLDRLSRNLEMPG